MRYDIFALETLPDGMIRFSSKQKKHYSLHNSIKMKKALYLAPLFALAFAACTSNEPDVVGGASDYEGNQFLSININTAGGGTRAEDYTAEDGTYRDGSEAENGVTSVRFYFFTANGAAASVKKVGTGYQSYYDLPADLIKENANNDGNVEKFLTAQIVINSDDNDKVPYSVTAVLNLPSDFGTDNLSLSQLNAKIADYCTADLTAAKKFVMSNSAYLDESGKEVKAVPVIGHIYADKVQAEANPVDIYVERVVAKMFLAVEMKTEQGKLKDGVYETGVDYELVDMQTGETMPGTTDKIYVKFLGWNVTPTTATSYLVKNINPEWDKNLLGSAKSQLWNSAERCRSFWAINPNQVVFNYGNFGQGLTTASGSYVASGNYAKLNDVTTAGNSRYMPENAAVFNGTSVDPLNNSKVIIAAQLVDKNEQPITLVEWGFNYYTVKGVKKLILSQLPKIYVKTTDPNESYRQIGEDDIEFATAGSLDEGKMKADAKGRYYVYPVLKKGAVYTLSDDQGTDETAYNTVNDLVKKQGPLKIWNEGYTYYYFDIDHIGAPDGPGAVGVVRNHIYETTVEAVSGLGTPVYDPTETIYPEKPTNDKSLIAARIKVLNWRIVKNKISLNW